MNIGKYFLLLIFFFIFPLFSICQGFYPGIYGGIVASQVDGDRLSGYNKPGATLGLLVAHNLTKISYIQTEIEFIQKGSRRTARPDLGYDSSYEIKLNYAEVTFLYNYVINKKYIPEAGLGFAYLINSAELINDYSQSPVPAFKNYEYSAILGFNYKAFEKFRINVRWSYSLFPIRKLLGAQTLYFQRSQYNNLLSFSIYYYFLNPSKKK